MLRKPDECKTEIRENMRGGDGSVKICHHTLTDDELYGKGRLFATITLDKGCSIGYHTHDNDCEIFHIREGVAEYNDNGTVCTANAGDVLICNKGEGHSIKNAGDTPVVLTALIVYA